MLSRTVSKNLLEHISLGLWREDRKGNLVSLASFLDNILGGNDVCVTRLGGGDEQSPS